MNRRFRLISFLLLTIGLVATLYFLLYEALFGRTSSSFITGVAVGGVISSLAAAGIAIVGRLSNERYVPVRIAIAGAKRTGKTVFVNVLYKLLMEGHDRALEFTPEKRTAQAVFQTVRNIARGVWPKQTPVDNIRTYKGEVIDRRMPWTSRLIYGFTGYGLEIGDSAGEIWSDIAEEYRSDEKPFLIESTFFEYVASSDLILYFIDAKAIRSSPPKVRRAVDDMISTIELLRAGSGRRRTQVALGIVISKSDLFDEAERVLLEQLLLGPSEFSLIDAQLEDNQYSALFLSSIRQLERLKSLLQRLDQQHETFIISSVAGALDAKLIDTVIGLGKINDVGMADAVSRGVRPVLDPLRWGIVQVWRRRKS